MFLRYCNNKRIAYKKILWGCHVCSDAAICCDDSSHCHVQARCFELHWDAVREVGMMIVEEETVGVVVSMGELFIIHTPIS